MGFFDDDDDALVTFEDVASPARAQADFRQLETDLMEKSAQLMGEALNFDQIDPEQEHPPVEWIEAFGEREAYRKLRMARYALMPKKDVPYGMTLAEKTFEVISRARAKVNAPKTQSNVQIIQLPDIPNQKSEEVFGVLDVVEDQDDG